MHFFCICICIYTYICYLFCVATHFHLYFLLSSPVLHCTCVFPENASLSMSFDHSDPTLSPERQTHVNVASHHVCVRSRSRHVVGHESRQHVLARDDVRSCDMFVWDVRSPCVCAGREVRIRVWTQHAWTWSPFACVHVHERFACDDVRSCSHTGR